MPFGLWPFLKFAQIGQRENNRGTVCTVAYSTGDPGPTAIRTTTSPQPFPQPMIPHSPSIFSIFIIEHEFDGGHQPEVFAALVHLVVPRALLAPRGWLAKLFMGTKHCPRNAGRAGYSSPSRSDLTGRATHSRPHPRKTIPAFATALALMGIPHQLPSQPYQKRRALSPGALPAPPQGRRREGEDLPRRQPEGSAPPPPGHNRVDTVVQPCRKTWLTFVFFPPPT